MTMLYLIRHGETVWNAEGRFQGHKNSALNALGRTQAMAVAQAMADYPFAAIYTSDLDRAAETARIIAAPHHLTPIGDPRLREACFGEWEGFTLPEISERWPDTVAAWHKDSLHTRPPGGETLEQVHGRVAEILAEITARYPDDEVAVVGHGGSLKAMITLTLGATYTTFRRIRLDNCSISILRAGEERCSLIRSNDICHLKGELPHATWDETSSA